MERKPSPASIDKDLVGASATPLILSILSRGENYGYEIAKEVRRLSGGEMAWADGMLYPVLHRLEERGLIRSEWRKSESGRKQRYYFIEKAGKKKLAEQRRQWIQVFKTLNRSWEASHV